MAMEARFGETGVGERDRREESTVEMRRWLVYRIFHPFSICSGGLLRGFGAGPGQVLSALELVMRALTSGLMEWIASMELRD